MDARSERIRKQVFQYRGGVPIVAEDLMPPEAAGRARKPPWSHHISRVAAIVCDQSNSKEKDEMYKPSRQSVTPPPPSYVTYDRCCLRFNATFKDDYITRHVIISYFLEDDTMTIVEPSIPNSGLVQGKVLTRQKAKRDYDMYWKWNDLTFDEPVRINGRNYEITGCDSWTKAFYEKAGIDISVSELKSPQANGSPQQHSPSSNHARTSSGAGKRYKLRQYLEHDGHILRFNCTWDRTGLTDLRSDEVMEPCILNYFLADDTLEVRKTKRSACSPATRGTTALYGPEHSLAEQVLIKRQRIKKNSGRYTASPLDEEDMEHVGPEDIEVGRRLDIYGKKLIINDFDDFTRSFYEQHFGSHHT